MPESSVLLEKEVLPIVQLSDAEQIDHKICKAIDELTKEDNQIWTSPDHDRREYAHSFFQYPAMMVPVVQKKVIEIIIKSKPSITNVLDPYMGSGTSLVACMENGLDCYGQDINPLAVLVTKTRTGPFYFGAIKKRKEQLFDNIDKDKSKRIEAKFNGLHKWFKDEVIRELSKIVRAIRGEKRLAVRRFYWVILAETVRLTSNDRTSTFKMHARSQADILKRKLSPIDYFKYHFENCLDDVESYAKLLDESDKLSKGSYIGFISLNLADSKQIIYTPEIQKQYFDMLVTSPPYGDNKTTVTYGQYSYLPLQWIELKDIDENTTRDFLRTTSEIDSRGLGGKIRKIKQEDMDKLFIESPTLKKIYNTLVATDFSKSKKVINFFYDINQSIKNIHSSLKVNSYQVWTVGNRTVAGIEIPNNEIMSEFIKYRGSVLIKTISREILNRRMAKRNSSGSLMTYEDILIFRKVATEQ